MRKNRKRREETKKERRFWERKEVKRERGEGY